MSVTTEKLLVMASNANRPIRDEKYLSVYANIVRLGASINDFSLTFSLMEDIAGQPSLVDKTTVFLSPVSFKAFVANVAMVLEQYESVMGSIPQSQGTVDAMNDLAPQVRANFDKQFGKAASTR